MIQLMIKINKQTKKCSNAVLISPSKLNATLQNMSRKSPGLDELPSLDELLFCPCYRPVIVNLSKSGMCSKRRTWDITIHCTL